MYELSFKGLGTVQKNLNRLQYAFRESGKDALEDTASAVRDRSLHYTPEDTRATKESTKVEAVAEKGGNAYIDVSVNTPYSFAIHYGYHKWHIPHDQPFKLKKNPNSSLFFLNKGLMENAEQYFINLSNHIEKAYKKVTSK